MGALRNRCGLFASSAIGGVALTLAVGSSAAAQPRTYNIPSESLSQALRDYGRQSGLQIIFTDDLVRGRTAPAVKGALEPQAALGTLLGGSGLHPQSTPTGVVMIVRDQGPTNAAAPAANEPAQVSEVTVTGTHLRQTASEDSPVAVTVFSRDRIDQLGATNVVDILKYLPSQSFNTSEQFTFGGADYPQLRGLGRGSTLILINGRRTVTSALGASSAVFDLNAIPLAAVKRVEVLADSASAIYGADAVGGVVNIILKDKVDETTADLYYGSASGGAGEYRGSLTTGYQNDRFSGMLVLDQYRRDFLPGDARSYYHYADYRAQGGKDLRFPVTDPGNVCSVSGANLPGLGAPCAAVPQGSPGVGLTPASFAATAGTSNLDGFLRDSSIIPATRTYSLSANGEFALTGNVTAFGELLYSHRTEEHLSNVNFLFNTQVPATNAFNPFGTAVKVSYLISGVGPENETDQTSYLRAVGGFRGQIGRWDWEVSGLATNDQGSDTLFNVVNSGLLTASLASSDPTKALNVFQDGPGGSASLLASLITPPVPDKFQSSAYQGNAQVRGDLFRLPAGPIQAVVGVEVRREEIEFNAHRSVLFLDVSRDTESSYAEARVPITAENSQLGASSLTIAGRYDHYSDFGGTFNPQIGFEAKPFDQLTVRANYSTSYRAPTLFQLFSPRRTTVGLLPDPTHGNQRVSVTVTSGGNPDLQPEKSRAFSGGFILRPFGDDRVRLSVTYWNIHQDTRLFAFSASAILNNEALFASRVTRAAPTPAETAAGEPGQLLALDATSVDFGALDTDGVDAELASFHETSFGRLGAQAAITFVNSFKSADVPGAPIVQRVGIANINGSVPSTKATATFSWERGPIAASATARYTASYKDVDQNNVPTGSNVKSQTLVDVQTSIALDAWSGSLKAVTSGARFRVGVINLFDRTPPFSRVAEANLLAFDPSQADPRQRFIYVALSKKF